MPKHIGELPKEFSAEQILQHVLQHYGALTSTNLREVEQWWGTKQAPEVIVLCSNSTRKAIMFALLAKMYTDIQAGTFTCIEDYFPHNTEEPFNRWFGGNVANGDGSLKNGEPHYIGSFFGVQLWVQPTRGEGSKNEQPMIEAAVKAAHGRTEWEKHVPEALKGKRTVFVGADTVEHVTLPNGKKVSHGKPSKHPEYPHMGMGEDPVEFAQNVNTFHEKYIKDGYPIGAEVEHVVAVAFFAHTAGTLTTEKIESGILPTRYTVEEGMLKGAVIDPDAGGAGLTQQLEIIFQGMDAKQRIAMLCQIMGAPLMPILEMIKRMTPEQDMREDVE